MKRSNSFLAWLLFLMSIGYCGAAWAQTPVRLDSKATVISMAGQMAVLRGDIDQTSPVIAQAAPGWQALAGELNAGFTLDSVWVQLAVDQPESGLTDWRLEVDSSLIEDIRFYQQTPGQRWTEQRSGLVIAHSDWPLDTRSPTFRLLLPQGRHLLMLRLQSRTPLVASIRLWPAERFEAHARNEALGWGVYLGMFALVGLLQFVFWLFAREAISVWYLPYALMIFLLGLIYSSYLQNTLNFSGEITRLVAVAVATLTLLLFGKFASSQLGLASAFPTIHRFFLWFSAALVAITFVLAVAPPYPYTAVFPRALWIVWLVILFGQVGVSARQGNPLARIFLIAFGVLFAGVMVRFLRSIGLVAQSVLADYSFQFTVLLHMLIVSLFIIYRYNALKLALQVAEAARQQQRDFVAMVSHEFRTPLAIISTSVQQIANNLDAPEAKTARRCDNVRAATRRMTVLMDDYLSLDRIDSDTHPLQPQAFNIEKELQLAAAERPKGRVELAFNDLPARFVCDPSLMRIVIRNLLANADRHSPVDRPIHLIAQGDGRGGIRVTVTDHGEGVAADEMAKIFLKYFRGRSAQRRPGAGLGLYLVNRIAVLHGGNITVVNAADGGAAFTLNIPSA